MHTGFYHLRGIDEEGNGLRMTFEEAPPGFLRKDHPQFQMFRDLLLHQLHETQTRGIPQATWLTLDDQRFIAEVRMVGKGVPLSARRDDSGGYLIVFPLGNVPMRLRVNHPRFQEFEDYLRQALEQEKPLCFVTASGDLYTIDDMVPPAAA
jgi:hypothetical protein